MQIRYNGELIEKAVYVLRWTKRRKRERESRQTIWVLSYGNASGIQHPPHRTYMTSPIKTSNSGIHSKNSPFFFFNTALDHPN
jgi:hypothetical protein